MVTFTQLLTYDIIALTFIFYMLLLVTGSSRSRRTYPMPPRVFKALIACLVP